MPRKKTEAKRLAILDAATEVFSRREFDEVLTDDVAAAAGVGKGTLYRYFPTKDDLYFQILVRGFDELDAVLAVPRPAAEPVADRLAWVAREVVRIFRGRQPFTLLPRVSERRLCARRRELDRRRAALIRFVEETVAAGVARGEVRPLDPRVGAELFIGMVRAATYRAGSAARSAAFERELMAVFLDGVRHKEVP